MAAITCISSYILWWDVKIIFLSDVTFPTWPSKSVKPNFPQYHSDRNNTKYNYCLEIQSKTAERISIVNLNLLKLFSNQTHIWCQFSVVARWLRQLPFFPISVLQNQLKSYLLFQKSLKNGSNNLYFFPYAFDERQKSFLYLASLFHSGPVNPSTSTFPNISLTETINI